ncbi:hypothetical protein [Hymenobacter convexus]|uniref:hypothetical protein n=1 Tax=Hymenobacter sp. CA1UV-4 TaxID=3063782 RepID=UPI002712ED58|nr:hypothetical protein [Hymenobacter sp. CA1UV-4]MDO7851614.1 hypothetical protein [Hymenobacter sp. CA1UV-4]
MRAYSQLLLYLLLSYFLFGTADKAYAQTSQCPYEYFQLRTNERDYFSFNVAFKGTTRLACGTFQDVKGFYKKYPPFNREYTDYDLASILARGLTLKSPVPLDSLVSLDFALMIDIEKANAIAAKGEQYFLAYYFNRFGGLREDRKASPAAVMKHLQKWCIAASQDDETGILCARYKFAALNRK